MDDLLCYCNDILLLGVGGLSAHLTHILWDNLIAPVLLPAANLQEFSTAQRLHRSQV